MKFRSKFRPPLSGLIIFPTIVSVLYLTNSDWIKPVLGWSFALLLVLIGNTKTIRMSDRLMTVLMGLVTTAIFCKLLMMTGIPFIGSFVAYTIPALAIMIFLSELFFGDLIKLVRALL